MGALSYPLFSFHCLEQRDPGLNLSQLFLFLFGNNTNHVCENVFFFIVSS